VRVRTGHTGAGPFLTALPTRGASGKVFVTSTVTDCNDLSALCLDARSGRQLWMKTITRAREKLPRNNLCSCSPVAGKRRVFFVFGDGTAACLNQEGREIWKRNLAAEYGPFTLKYGYSSSPLLYDGRVYILVLRRSKSYRGPVREGLDSFLLAMDPDTGETIFRHVRASDAVNETMDSYTSPLPAVLGGVKQILVYGADYLSGHDAGTGRELWRWRYDATQGKMNRTIPTPVFSNGVVYCVSSRGKRMMAVTCGKTGEEQEPPVWEIDYRGPDVACQVVYRGGLYSLDDRGKKVLSCLDPATGRVRWTGQVDQSSVYYASLTAADGKLYMVNDKGVVSVVGAKPGEFQLLDTVLLGEGPVRSSVAVAGGKVYVRTAKTLYCFEKEIVDEVF